MPDGPSDEAGVRSGETSATIGGIQINLGGDIITAVEGEKVTEMEEIVAIVNESEPGESLALTLIRDGSEKKVTVTLADRPDSVEEGSRPE